MGDYRISKTTKAFQNEYVIGKDQRIDEGEFFFGSSLGEPQYEIQ